MYMYFKIVLTSFFQVDVFALVRSWRTRREQIARSAAQYEHLLQVACAQLDQCVDNSDEHLDISSGGDRSLDYAYARVSRNIEVALDGDNPHDRDRWTTQSAHEDLLEIARPTNYIGIQMLTQ